MEKAGKKEQKKNPYCFKLHKRNIYFLSNYSIKKKKKIIN